MGPSSSDAAVRVVQIMLEKKECASGMGQRLNQLIPNDAAVRDAQAMLRKEECALGMEPRSNDAAVMDAQAMLRKEECASGMGQRWNPNDAAERRWEERRIKTIMFGSMRYLSWPVRQGLMRTCCWKFATDLFLADCEIDSHSPLYFRNDNCYWMQLFFYL